MKNILRIIKENSFYETLSHSKYYFISNLAVKGIGIFSLPVLTRLLLPSDYGVISLFNSYNGIFISLLTLNCYVALGRYYYEEQDDLMEFFGTSITFIFSLLFLFLVLFIIFRNEISSLLSLPTNVIILFVPTVMVFVFSSWYEQIYVPQKKSKQIAVRNVISSYGKFALVVIITLVLSKDKYLGSLYASIITGALFTVYYLYALKPYIKFTFSVKSLKYMLNYSLPLIPYTLGAVILSQIDRIVINKYYGETNVGLYSFAYSIGSLLTLVLSSLQLAWTPVYFKLMAAKNYSKLNADITLILKIVMVCAFFLILFGKEIGMMLAKSNFYSALHIVPIVVIGLVIYSYSTFYSWHIQFAKKNIYMTPILLISGFTSTLLNLIFIPKYGYVAAPFVNCVSYLVMVIMGIIVTKYILELYTTPIFQITKPLLIMIPFIGAYYLLPLLNLHIAVDIILKLFFLFVFIFILFYSHLIKIYKTIATS